MIKITSTHLQRHMGEVLVTVQQEPVVITSQGRDRAVLMSHHDYVRLAKREPVSKPEKI